MRKICLSGKYASLTWGQLTLLFTFNPEFKSLTEFEFRNPEDFSQLAEFHICRIRQLTAFYLETIAD